MLQNIDISIEVIVVLCAVLLLLSVLSSKVSSGLGIPALALFLAIGMLAGSEGLGGIHFDDPHLAQSMGVVALIFILFAGGLSTDWRTVRPNLWNAVGLSTAGVLGTALLVGWFVSMVLSLPFAQSLLLGSIISSTDAAAVFAVLRSRNVSLKGDLKPLLELESGSNDPMAVFLTLGVIQLLTNPHSSILSLVPMFAQHMLVGSALGYAFGRVSVSAMNRVRLEYEGLYSVLLIALVLLCYGLTTLCGGNGFLSIYVAGVVMGTHNFIHKNSLTRFFDGVAWLMQILMFVTLGLLVFPSHLIPVIPAGLFVAFFLMLIARPVAVFLCLSFSRFSLREKALVSWVGLRGAVPIILATFPLLSGVPQAEMFFNIVFFVALTSVLIQGTSIPLVAKVLKVDAPFIRAPVCPLEFIATSKSKSDLVEVAVAHASKISGKQLVDIEMPEDILIVLISRNGEFLIPKGRTVIEGGDVLVLLADQDQLSAFEAFIAAKDDCPTVAPQVEDQRQNRKEE